MQGIRHHKKSNQGFGSDKYDPEKKLQAQRLGGSRHVAKGFSKMTLERRREIAQQGSRA